MITLWQTRVKGQDRFLFCLIENKLFAILLKLFVLSNLTNVIKKETTC